MTTAIIKTDPLTTTQGVAEELNFNHSTVVQHLKQTGKVRKLNKWVSHELSENQKIHHFELSSYLLHYTKQWTVFLMGLWCAVKSRLWHPAMTSSVVKAKFSSVHSLSHVWLFETPWTEAHWASLFITSSQSQLKLISIKSVMPFNHLILHHPLLLPSILSTASGFFPMSQLFTLGGQIIGASASVLPKNIQGWFPLGLTGLILVSKGLSIFLGW